MSLPAHITTIIYIDPTVPIGGDGSIGNPYSVHYSGSTNTTNTAYLFKRGTVSGSIANPAPTFDVVGANNYVGSYGEGAIHERITQTDRASGRGFNLVGDNNLIEDIKLTGTDIMNNGVILRLHGALAGQGKGTVRANNLILSNGNRGIDLNRVDNVYIDGVEIFDTADDSIAHYDGANGPDLVVISNSHLHLMNYNFLQNRLEGNNSGGDAIHINTQGRIEVWNTILDHSLMPHKAVYINTELVNQGNYFHNVTFIAHPQAVDHINSRNNYIHGCKFLGGDTLFPEAEIVEDCVIAGFGKDFSYTAPVTGGDMTWELTGLPSAALKNFRRNIVIGMNKVFRTGGTATPTNVNDCYFFNCNTFSEININGTGNKHSNLSGSQAGLDRYAEEEAYEIIDCTVQSPTWRFMSSNFDQIELTGGGYIDFIHEWYEMTSLNFDPDDPCPAPPQNPYSIIQTLNIYQMEPIATIPTKYIVRGNTLRAQSFTIATQATPESPLVPVNLDLFQKIIIQYRGGTQKGKIFAEFTKDDLQIDDPATGTYIRPDVQTKDWPVGNYYFDHLLQFDDNDRLITYIGGQVVLVQNVSNLPKE